MQIITNGTIELDGNEAGDQDTFDLGSLNESDGFTITGKAVSGGFGNAVSGAGDVNGDGLSDIFIGGSGKSRDAEGGAKFVVFGSTDAIPAEI